MKYLLLVLLTTGCASASLIKETKDGGRVRNNSTGSVAEAGGQAKAVALMQAKCPQGFEIIETGRLPALAGSELELSYQEFKCKTQ